MSARRWPLDAALVAAAGALTIAGAALPWAVADGPGTSVGAVDMGGVKLVLCGALAMTGAALLWAGATRQPARGWLAVPAAAFIAILTTLAALDTRQALRDAGVAPSDLAAGTHVGVGIVALYAAAAVALVGGVLAIREDLARDG